MRAPCERRERLDLLQRVTRHARTKSLPNNRVQVHEDLAPQQVVDRVLARAVFGHELFQRSVLVRAVVIHVHSGIGRQSIVNKIDKRLEHAALCDSVVRPDRPVLPVGAIAQKNAEQKVQAARRLPKRIALYVEYDVTL